MSATIDVNVIRQQTWTEAELVARGFRHYPRKKQVVMVRELTVAEAPKTIVTAWDTLVAEAGHMICYEPGDVVWPGLDDYFHWPVEAEIFQRTYKFWDIPDWSPSASQAHLMSLGCKPYYKFVGVWAKKLTEPATVQSLESPKPVIVPAGVWLTIGVEGEPYSMSERSFTSRYEQPENSQRNTIQSLISFFRRRRR